MDRRALRVDDGGMTGQTGHARASRGTAAVTAVSVLVAGTLLSAVVAAARQSTTASAATLLQTAAGAELVLADGTRRAAVPGEEVPRGASVTLPGPGRAVLVAGDRETYLAQGSTVRVLDGIRQELTGGTAFVDAEDADAGLELTTAAGRVTVRREALVRVDGAGLPRVAVLRGAGAQVRASGRRTATEVDAYQQVQVPVGGLPGRVAPVRLVPDDAYEQQLARALVDLDRYLGTTGDTLVRSPQQGSVLRAALEEQAPGVLADREGGIAYLIAAAVSPDDVAAALPEVRSLRAQGGSWGAVASLLGASVDEVGSRLDALLAPTALALPAPGGGPLDVAEVLGTSDPGVPAPGPSSSGPAPQPQPGDEPDGPAPSPTPVPVPTTPADDAVATVTETVDGVVDTVLDLIAPSPSAAPARPATVPSPRPLLDLPLLPPLLPLLP